MRGLAALCVLNHHLVGAFFPYLVPPAPRNDGKDYVPLQLPVLRTSYEAGMWLSVFFILSGYFTARTAAKVFDGADSRTHNVFDQLTREVSKVVLRLLLPASLSSLAGIVC